MPDGEHHPMSRREYAEYLAFQLVANGSPLAPLALEFQDLLERERAREGQQQPTGAKP